MIAPRILITGAGGGIGAAIAERLGAVGASLLLIDRDPGRLADVAAAARTAGAASIEVHALDLTDAERLRAAVGAAGPLNGIVCAAGVLEPAGLHEVTDAAWQRQFAVNTTAVLHVLQAAEVADGGSVVVIGSNAARVPRMGMLAYAASKAATAALVRGAGLELAARGIRCNVLEPGSTDTPMQRDLWPDAQAGLRTAIEGDPSTFRLGIPLGRIADPADIAEVAAFLLSDGARHITLQQLLVDGGATL